MKTDELREVLDRHAREVASAASRDRVGSVRARIARARRKRAAAAGLATAGVVAAFVVVPGLIAPSGPGPAPQPAGPPAVVDPGRPTPTRLAGYRLPASQVVDGVRYDLIGGRTGAAPVLTMNLPARDQPRILAVASDAADLSATVSLRIDGVEVARTTAGGLESGHLVEPGAHVVVVRLSKPDPASRLGLAVYGPAESRGLAVVFPEQLGGDELIAWRIGATGENELRLDVVVPPTGIRLSAVCVGGLASTIASTSVNGHPALVVPCRASAAPERESTDKTIDADSGLFERWGIEPGGTVHVRTWLTTIAEPPAVIEDPSASLAMGVYRLADQDAGESAVN